MRGARCPARSGVRAVRRRLGGCQDEFAVTSSRDRRCYLSTISLEVRAGSYECFDPRHGNQSARPSPSRPDPLGTLSATGFRGISEMVVSATGRHSCAGVDHAERSQDSGIRLA